MFSVKDKDPALKRNFSQNEQENYSQQSSSQHSQPKKPKTRQTYSLPSAEDASKIRDRSISPVLSPSLVASYQEASSSDEAEHDDIGKSPYMIKPSLGTLFDASEMEKFFERYKRSLPDCYPIRTAAELQDMVYKFHKSPINKNHFCQFQYKKPPLLFIVTNTYGVFISTSEDYFSRSTIHNIRALQLRHRVSLLIPTIQHWWNEESKEMMLIFLERFINDMKCLAASQQFRSAIDRFGIGDIKESLKALPTKLITATKNINGQITPGVFGLRIENTLNVPSQIHVSLAEINGRTIQLSKWKKLLVPSYMHAALMISVKGFKITKSGFSLDFNVESLAYMKVSQIDRAPRRSLKEFKKTPGDHSSSSDDDENINVGASTSSGSSKIYTSMW